MPAQRYRIVYDPEVIQHLKLIERKYHSLIRITVETQLSYEPEQETLNRKPLVRTAPFGARWELRLDDNNQFRVFYSVNHEKRLVHILAIGVKDRECLYIGGKETRT
jgi:mRNA-degrading endonuclease RelE of RelBE toxin-antitoxin system